MPQYPEPYVWIERITVGHIIRRDDYLVQIIDGPSTIADMFGRPMLSFEGRIESGPDRVGEIGDLMYGPRGVVQVVNHKDVPLLGEEVVKYG